MKFFFDQQLNKCSSFLYQGCGGNDNRFDEENRCIEKCVTETPVVEQSTMDSVWNEVKVSFDCLRLRIEHDSLQYSMPIRFWTRWKWLWDLSLFWTMSSKSRTISSPLTTWICHCLVLVRVATTMSIGLCMCHYSRTSALSSSTLSSPTRRVSTG